MESPNETQDTITDKINKKLRYSGIISASFTLVQCIIWIILCVIGICFCFFEGNINSVTFSAFKYVYFNIKGVKTVPTILSPVLFNLICWLYLIGCSVWLIISIKLIRALYVWKKTDIIRKYLKTWIIFTYSVCLIDLLFSILFLVDFKYVQNFNQKELLLAYNDTFAFKSSDSFDISSEENVKELKEIGILERDLRHELKEYLLLKNHVKNQFIHGSLSMVTVPSNDEFKNPFQETDDQFKNPFERTFEKKKRAIERKINEHFKVPLVDNYKIQIKPDNSKLEIPSAVLMTIFMRGIIVWLVNLIMTSYMNYQFVK